MEHTPFVQLSRPAELALPPVNTKPTVQWRRIALLSTPILLAVANLIEAGFEKQRGFAVAAFKYLEFKGRGEALREATIRAAIERGKARYDSLIAEAKNQAQASVEVGQKERETRIAQGKDKAVINVQLANGLVISLFGRMKDITRLVHERAEDEVGMAHGRYLKVNRKTGEYTIEEVATNEPARADLVRRLKLQAYFHNNLLAELREVIVANGANEMVTFAGGTCADIRWGGNND